MIDDGEGWSMRRIRTIIAAAVVVLAVAPSSGIANGAVAQADGAVPDNLLAAMELRRTLGFSSDHHAREVVADLASAGVDVIVYGVTSGSFFFGRATDEAFQAELEQRSGCPVVSTSSAVVEALHSLGLARISVVTPYKDELNVQLPPYLAEHGIEVVAMCTGATDRPDLVTADEVVALARRAWRSDGDGLFISCTGLPTLDLIGPLEGEIGRPVITSNQASFWAAARLAGLTVRRGGVGRLLA